jgi:GPI mannosyltransferase 2
MTFDFLAWLATASWQQVALVSVATRVLIISWMWFSHRVIGGGECYDSCDTFYHERYTATNYLNHWDSVHFRHVAMSGYSHEHVHAFFPGVPALHVVLEEYLGLPAVSVNILAVIAYTVALLALRGLTRTVARRYARLALPPALLSLPFAAASAAHDRFVGATVFLFLASPTNVFTVVSYTESFFACACLLGLYFTALDPVLSKLPSHRSATAEVRLRQRYNDWFPFLGAWLCFVAASLFRSNGFLLACIVMVPPVVTALSSPLQMIQHHRRWLLSAFLRGLMCLVVLVPYLLANFVGWDRYCRDQLEAVYGMLRGDRCKVTGFYPMIQALYWNVGWFRQWTLTNSPNFLIAAPPILIGAQSLLRHSGRLRSFIQFSPDAIVFNVHVWHLVGLWYLAVTTIHVQVVNRLVFACPAVYWLGAWQLVSEPRGWITRVLVAYCVVCSVIGPLMFANHMNWT